MPCVFHFCFTTPILTLSPFVYSLTPSTVGGKGSVGPFLGSLRGPFGEPPRDTSAIPGLHQPWKGGFGVGCWGPSPKFNLQHSTKLHHSMPGKKRGNSSKSGKKPKSGSGRSRRSGPRGMPLQYVNPPSKKVHLVFYDTSYVAESATGTGGTHFYRLNSAYDVDTNVGSTTIPGFNEWQNFYTSYRVWRARIRVIGTVNVSSSNGVCTVTLTPNAYTATIPSNPKAWPVQPQSVFKVVPPVNAGSNAVARLDHTFNLPRLAALTPQQYKTDMDFTANVASNPSRQLYCAVTVQGNTGGGVATYVYSIWVSLEIEFFNPATLSA